MLRPADILLWRSGPGSSWFDRLIGWGEQRLGQSSGDGYEYYHAAFVSANPFVIFQSKPPSICMTSIPDALPPYIQVCRLITPPTEGQLNAIFGYARSRIGKPYDFLGVLSGGFFEVGGLEFCSKFTNDAFSYGGIVLVPSEELISPDDIAASKLIYRIA